MARSFNGSTQVLSSTTTPVTTFPFTIAGWSYPTDFTAGSSDKYIAALGDTAGTSNYFGLLWRDADSKLSAASVNFGVTRIWVTTAAGSLNTWQHVAGVWESASSCLGYINANSTGSYMSSGSPTPSSIDAVSFGALKRSSIAAYYYGRLAEFGIWNVALSQDELTQLAEGYAPLMVKPQNLVAYFPMHGRSGASGSEENWAGFGTLTQTNSPALADHPRIIYPRRRTHVYVPGAAATAPSITALSAIGITATSAQPRISYS